MSFFYFLMFTLVLGKAGLFLKALKRAIFKYQKCHQPNKHLHEQLLKS